jgi:dienelactone hydrolase
MKFSTIAALCLLMLTQSIQAKLHTETIEYRQGATVLEGFLAYDDSFRGTRPGILVIHEWDGIGDYVKSRAEQLAKLGYVAFAPDIYGKSVRPKTPQESGAEASKYRNDRPLMRERATAGLEQLQKNNRVDPARIAAIGYCFGGTVALELARGGANIAGVVSFHGGPDTPNPDDAKNIKGKVLLLHGAADPHVKREAISAFQDEMDKAGIDYQIVMYSGAVHGFTNPHNTGDPSTGVAYNETADKRSWNDMVQFFEEIFKK